MNLEHLNSYFLNDFSVKIIWYYLEDWIYEKYDTHKIVKFSLRNVILGTLNKDIILYMMF